MREGYTQTVQALFPNVDNNSSTTFDPTVTTQIVLPNNKSYTLQYNVYGELARVTLPTGGIYEYDYEGLPITTGNGTYGIYDGPPGKGQGLAIARGVKEKRIYSASGALEGKIKYGSSGGAVTVTYCRPDDSVISVEKHYFNGSPTEQTDSQRFYDYWNKGREYKTEYYAADGATLLRVVDNTWQQGYPISAWSGFDGPNNPRTSDVVKTLSDTNQKSKVHTDYDDTVSFNNPKDVYEYDFGAGAPGGLIRRTHTDYQTSTSYTNTPVHLRSLPTQQSVYDAGGTERARATYEYDNYANDGNHAPLTNCTGIVGMDAGFTTSYLT